MIYLAIYDSSQRQFVDITKYLAPKGFKLSRNDVDAANSGRSQDGLMHRGRVAIKRKIECKCRPMNDEEIKMIETLIEPEYIQVKYYDTRYGSIVTRTMYSNNVNSTHCIAYDTVNELWEEFSFPLVEQ